MMDHPFKGFEERYQAGLEASETGEATRRPPRFYNLLQLFKLAAPIRGATAEVGCYRGLSSYLLCHALKAEDAEFTGAGHHIVDSFEGLSPPTPEDEIAAKAAGRFNDTSVEHVRKTLQEFPDVAIFRGWAPETLQSLPEQEYRFIHIDVDLYTPTLGCLEYFYPRLSRGGLIVVDDFGPWPSGGRYPGCSRAVNEFSEKHGVEFAALTTGNAFCIKRPPAKGGAGRKAAARRRRMAGL